MPLDFAVLGVLEVSRDGRPLVIVGNRQKALLAALLLRAGQLVGADELVDRVWADQLPSNPTGALHSLVLRLRRTLDDPGGVVIRSHGNGYLAAVEPERVDLGRFKALWDRARAADAAGDGLGRAALMREALALWRGEPLTGVHSDPLHHLDVPALVELRERATQEYVEAELAVGRDAEIVPLLREAIGRTPLREGLWRQLMLALYRGGRQAEALEAYRQVDKLLDSELGVTPGAELRQLYQDILNAEPSLTRQPAPPPADTAAAASPLFALPADPGPLHGRDRAVAELRRLLTAATDRTAVAAVSGPPGAGKTALALHVAHTLRDEFPDGQWYLPLGGHRPLERPVDPQVELLGFAGVSGGAVPATPAARSAALRAALADRRVLIVLDDAASAEQVAPLLPGTGGSAVVVTARDRLGGLVALHGARAFEVGPLDPGDAAALVSAVFRDHGLAVRQDTVEELARHCGYLPLALRIAAANLATGTAADADDYIQRLRGTDRLGGLSVNGESGPAIRAAIAPSYHRLDGNARRALRLQAMSPSDDFTVADVAALLDSAWAEAAAAVRALAAAHLIRPCQAGRYVTHDLIRLYAAEMSRREDAEAERTAATERLLRGYLVTADLLARRAYPRMAFQPLPAGWIPPPAPVPPATAAAWFRAEHRNLVAAIRHAGDAGPPGLAWRLTDRMRGYLQEAGVHDDWRSCAAAGLAQARREGSDTGAASMESSLALLSASRADHADARRRYTAALAIYERLGDLSGQAAVNNNLGVVCRELGRLDQAGAHYERAIALYRRLGHQVAELSALSNASVVWLELDRLAEAASAQRAVLASLAASDDPHRDNDTANALHNLAVIARATGHPSLAVMYLTRTLAVRRRVGSRYGEATDLENLAASYVDLGYHAKGLSCAEQALALAQRIGRRRVEAEAFNSRAAARRGLGDLSGATADHRAALRLSREISYTRARITAHVGLALTHHAEGGAAPRRRGAGRDRRAVTAARHARIARRLAERTQHHLLARLARQAAARGGEPAWGRAAGRGRAGRAVRRSMHRRAVTAVHQPMRRRP